MSTAFTGYIDLAQVVLYVFWAFFFGLIWWLRKEDRREGYPLESDKTGALGVKFKLLIPKPKTFLLPHGGTYTAPNFERDTRDIDAIRSTASGSALEPTGDPMLSNTGPGSWAQRADEPELTHAGLDAIVPLRIEPEYNVSAGPDPRGWDVVATDGKVAGKVKDLWIDRADVMVRYLEVELADDGSTRLVPMTMLRLRKEPKKVEVASVRAGHFPSVPTLKSPDRITLLEEEKICAFYAAGRLYAEPKRLGPVV